VATSDFDLWLDPAAAPKALMEVVAQGARAQWASHPVGPSVNNVRNDSSGNIRRAEPAPKRQGSLF
jgi:putative SOS response-associated peptidase YedK